MRSTKLARPPVSYPSLNYMDDIADTPERVMGRDTTEDEMSLGYVEKTDSEGRYLEQVGVDREDRLTHFHVVGASGVGKSKFLEYLISQDLYWSFHGKGGFGLIDPHGDLLHSFLIGLTALSHGIESAWPESNIVHIDPTDRERTVCFNPLELSEGVEASQQARELVVAFKKIYGDAWGNRLEAMLRNALIVLIENNLALTELPLVLKNPAVRERLLRNVKNETCHEYFEDEYNKWSERTRLEWMQSTTNKIDDFLSDTRMRQIFSSTKSSFDLQQIMDNGMILLVNLSKGDLGEDNSNLLGSLLLSKIQMTAMKRKGDSHLPFYLYIDEFQNFASDSFVQTLDEARKFKLSLTLAHQNLSQVPARLRASLLTCGLQACFRVSRMDAEVLAKEFFAGQFADPAKREKSIERLQSLPQRYCYVKNHATGGVVKILVPAGYTPQIHDTVNENYRIITEGGKDIEDIIKQKNIGGRWLRKREDVEKEYRARRRALLGDDESEFFRDR